MLYYIPVLLVLPLGYKTKTTAGPKTNMLGQHPSMLRVVHGLVDPRVGSGRDFAVFGGLGLGPLYQKY